MEVTMYYGWTWEKGNPNGDNKYFPLLKEETIGIAKKNGTSLPLYCTNGQLVAIRNFGKNKIANSARLQNLLSEKEITVTGGPCLFSAPTFGVISEGIFYSLATAETRKRIPWENKALALKIGNPITQYHEKHVLFMQRAINRLKKETGKNVKIKIMLPGIEYTTYLPKSLSTSIREEYWEKVDKGGKELEKFYIKHLSGLGNISVLRKQEWDVQENAGTSRGLASYIDTYLKNTDNDGLTIATEDIIESHLLIGAGKRIKFLIGILGILNRLEDLEKKEETHPYLV